MLGKFFIKTKIAKNLKKKAEYVIPFRSMAVFSDASFHIDKTFVKKLADLTGVDYENIDVLFYSENETHPDFTTALKRHINFLGNITEPNIQKFLNKNYDLLIDFSNPDTPEKKLLSSGIQAGFRVGKTPEETAFYDLIIDCPQNKVIFLEELKKYFRALKFIP